MPISARLAALLLGTALAAAPLAAQLQPEELSRVELKDQFQPHWVWVNDVSFTRMADGRAYLLDADSGQFLGMVSGGLAHGSLLLAPDGKSVAVPATFYSRGSRGERTDVVTFYDAKTLAPGEEVVIPPKRFQSLPFLSAMPLTDDGRFALIYNFTPEQSVTVVDVAQHKLVGEYPTAGCGLVYPTGDRSFFMQCADGSLQGAAIGEGGAVTLGSGSPKLFEDKDPATEKPVRVSARQWLFFTFSSQAVLVDASGKAPAAKARWSLLGPDDAGWRLGGLQPAAYHAPSGRLYVLMHQGGPSTHKDPGTEIWVFDVTARKRIARYRLDRPATSVAISGDPHPLLYTILFGARDLAILDPDTGRKLRAVDGLGDEMTVIQPSPVAQGKR
ncbi:amine dehydrogenase large subunit [Flavisphingomonas formosensis]|uniref:amine dehydrogenase large subunit n=1 Tax=Flavisphingomonas formosensis TaxID=861534 RepID=UPI0012F9921C|nr:amine dehydrogenase large subunit [Sphingomonas formosensis]